MELYIYTYVYTHTHESIYICTDTVWFIEMGRNLVIKPIYKSNIHHRMQGWNAKYYFNGIVEFKDEIHLI